MSELFLFAQAVIIKHAILHVTLQWKQNLVVSSWQMSRKYNALFVDHGEEMLLYLAPDLGALILSRDKVLLDLLFFHRQI